MKESADCQPTAALRHHCHYLLLLLSLLLVPACAVTNTTTSLVPGKELGKSSLGFRETENLVTMKEINPYTVVVRRKVCKAELLSVEYTTHRETKYDTHTLDCSGEYVNYAARNITSLGMAFLYDSVTGFYLLRNKCYKNPPATRIVTAEVPGIFKKELFDDKSITCKEVPIADAVVTARANSNEIVLTASAKGIASLPPKTLAELQNGGVKAAIRFTYDTVAVATEFIPKKGENQNLTQLAAVNSSLGDAVVGRESESDSMAMSDQENAMKKDAGSSLSAAETEPIMKKNMLAGGVNAVTAPNPAAPAETDMMARLDPDSAMKKGSPKKAADDGALQPNRIARNVNSVSAANASAQKAETQSMAKLDDENAAMRKVSAGETAAESKQNKLPLPGVLVSEPAVVADSPVVAVAKAAAVSAPDKPVLTVRFDSNKAVVKKEYRAELQRIADQVKNNPALITIIEGHTDNIGSAEANRKMSLRRAGVIRDYFIRVHNIPKERIRVKGNGLTQPIADNSTEEGRAINRRTEIQVIVQSSDV